MSGGVDSSVAAALLKKQGFEIFGITFIVASENTIGIQIPDKKHIEDAEKVAKKLNIDYEIVDVSKEFKTSIIDYFINEYQNGKTPNPCVKCNKMIKISKLFELAQKYNTQFIATGHYAQIEQIKNNWVLKKAQDKSKDQSYFLYDLPKEYLSKILFPLGKITKTKAREIAKSLGLHIAEKEDSQEICFIKDKSYSEFISKQIKDIKPGPILTLDGEQIGMHKGIIYYTIGQRKGIGIPFAKPFYVVKIDPDKNAIIVGDEKDTLNNELIAEKFNWISIEQPTKMIKAKAKIRFTSEETPVTVEKLDSELIKIKFAKPVKAITPGQSVVLYKKDIVLGGGIICKTN